MIRPITRCKDRLYNSEVPPTAKGWTRSNVVTATRKLNPITNLAVGENRRKGRRSTPSTASRIEASGEVRRGRRLFITSGLTQAPFGYDCRQPPPVACYLSREPVIHRPFPAKVEVSAAVQPRSRDNR